MRVHQPTPLVMERPNFGRPQQKIALFQIASNRRNGGMRSVFVQRKEITQAVQLERAELYFLAHHRGPSAARRPKLVRRGRAWVASLGRNLEESIVGFAA
jgi:hypothetical protein